MNAQPNQRGRHGPWQLPTNWRAIEGNPGELLYIARVCGNYYARPESGEWVAYHGPGGEAVFEGEAIGKGPTRDHALIVCRDHMHANEVRS